VHAYLPALVVGARIELVVSGAREAPLVPPHPLLVGGIDHGKLALGQRDVADRRSIRRGRLPLDRRPTPHGRLGRLRRTRPDRTRSFRPEVPAAAVARDDLQLSRTLGPIRADQGRQVAALQFQRPGINAVLTAALLQRFSRPKAVAGSRFTVCGSQFSVAVLRSLSSVLFLLPSHSLALQTFLPLLVLSLFARILNPEHRISLCCIYNKYSCSVCQQENVSDDRL
jgi:hypothetical protein